MGFEGPSRNDLSRPVGMASQAGEHRTPAGLGWQARHSLREGLAKTLAFYRTQAWRRPRPRRIDRRSTGMSHAFPWPPPRGPLKSTPRCRR